MLKAGDDTVTYWVLPTILSIMIFLAIYLKSNRATDPYGLFHLSLNRIPGDNPEEDPKTEWLNVGYWKASINTRGLNIGTLIFSLNLSRILISSRRLVKVRGQSFNGTP